MNRRWMWMSLMVALAGCMAYGGGQKAKAPPSTEATTMTSLNGTDWRVQEIGGQAVVDPLQTSLRIGADGAASGSTGCNRFTGRATIEGANLSFGPLATTMRACPDDDVTAQEKSFLEAMGAVRKFSLDGQGALSLEAADGTTLIRLVRAEP